MEKVSLRCSDKLKISISPHKRYIYKHLNEFSRKIIPKKKNYCIDVGAGTSYYKHIFNLNYISIDYKYFPNLDVIGMAQKLPFKSSIADMVLLVEVLEHIYEIQEVFREINRVIKHHGYLFLTVPFVYGYHESKDYFRFTETALDRLLNENGFEIVDIKKRGGIFSLLGAIIFNIPSTLFKNKNAHLFLAFLIPLIEILFLLDDMNLDRNKNFTLGIDILAVKEE